MTRCANACFDRAKERLQLNFFASTLALMTEFIRQPTHVYHDPLARVWTACAEAVGFRIVRTPDAYASTDGKGTLLIAVDEMFDPDDSLAQMIFHELCHALVEGEDGEKKEDWGIGYAIGNNPWREHAALRLQAYLAAQVGLRDFFAPTTDFRVSFWNALPTDPFDAPPEQGGRRERSCVAARVAAWRASQARWAKPLNQALAASAAIAAATPALIPSEANFRNPDKVEHNPGLTTSPHRITPEEPSASPLPSLWATVQKPPAAHPSGHAPVAAHFSALACTDCAWGWVARDRLHCRHAPAVRLPTDAPACWRFEPAKELDCLSCGACCREAYHAVEISGREAVNRKHPELVVIQDTRRKLLRKGNRCAALMGGGSPQEPFSCSIYEDRPRTCWEFTRGSENCLDARRRVGLSL